MHGKVEGNDHPLLSSKLYSSLRKLVTHDRGLTLELSEAEDGGSGVVEDVEERYSSAKLRSLGPVHSPRGFFLRTRKTVSMSSTYLM